MTPDNRVGIAAANKEQIFVRRFGKNTGLGLFMVREILGITGITITEPEPLERVLDSRCWCLLERTDSPASREELMDKRGNSPHLIVFRNRASNTTLPQPTVVPVAGDHMDMEMHDRLASRTPDVHPDIVPVWHDRPLEVLLRLQREQTEGRPLLHREVEVRREMPERDQQQMSWGDWMKVRPGIPEQGTKEDLLFKGVTERTGYQ